MIELKTVTKSYKTHHILRGISQKFEQGVTVITGKSGAGKSTLLRLCATVEKPSSGDILWQGGSIVKSPKTLRSQLGYAPQQIDFPPDITALDFLRYIGVLKGISSKNSSVQGMELLKRLALEKDGDKFIHMFSGGMRRRLGLAQAFLGTPQCIILDEPTAELDLQTAGLVHDLIFEHSKMAVVLMTTHLAASMRAYTFAEFEIAQAIKP